ncbi:BQ2448_6273 [Microbotryum intermedium]|uniref:BQ2448_6273 protein n=1 Tax=Microbotryum intermedium TaxID=269621 RepID=A0A238FPA7_9BASI|nr:BQ2448_6273 [Microbotryum intermedium]
MSSTSHPSTTTSPVSHAHQPLLLAARQLAQAHHSHYDPSHDYHHVQRVVRNALVIAKSFHARSPSKTPQGDTVSASEVEPAAVDLVLAPNQKGLTAQERLRPFWKENERTGPKEGALGPSLAKNGSEEKETTFSTDRQRLVESIMEHVSYSNEVKRIAQGGVSEWEKGCRELHCVQDADKLDAIGAFGIMRCSAYSAMTNRPLYVPPKADDPEAKGCAIQHFHDKLFKLQGMIKTCKGKEMAKRRTELMKVFIRGVEEEWQEGKGRGGV